MEQSILTLAQKKVLELLGNHTILAPRFYLSGGTALAEFYLKHGSLMKPSAQWLQIQAGITGKIGGGLSFEERILSFLVIMV